jgi:hypothetical protein
MKGIPNRSILLAGALVALAAVAAHADTIAPTAVLFDPGSKITYEATLTSGELHAGDGFTIFDIGGFLGFGTIPTDWEASFSAVGSPFSPPGPIGPDNPGLFNVHFKYTGDPIQALLIGIPFLPFEVLTKATLLVVDDFVSKDHVIGDPLVVGDGDQAPGVTGTILVPGLAGVPDSGSTMAFLGLGLIVMGTLRWKILG